MSGGYASWRSWTNSELIHRLAELDRPGYDPMYFAMLVAQLPEPGAVEAIDRELAAG